MLALQSQILEDPAVKEVFGWQAPDGWLAWSFHGYPSLEAGLRLLCEKGVDNRHPVLSRAVQALINCDEDRLSRGLGKPGMILDQCGLGGAQMIRAAVLAYAGIEDEPGVKEQIELALDGFRSVLSINRIDDLVNEYQGKPVFQPGIRWPSLYHLRLLAWTHRWRTPENQDDLVRCIQKLVELSPIPYLRLRYHSQLIAPAAFCMDTLQSRPVCAGRRRLDEVVPAHGAAGSPGGDPARARAGKAGRNPGRAAGKRGGMVYQTLEPCLFQEMGRLHRADVGEGLEGTPTTNQRPDFQEYTNPALW